MIITKETDYALRILRVLLDGEKHSVAELSLIHILQAVVFFIPLSDKRYSGF